jgi:glutathione S-transferase
MPITLYNSQVSGNCYKVRLLLAHLGIPYERVELDVVDRSQRAELLGGKNPALRVPTIELDDGRTLGESNAITWYFADETGYLPTDPFERAQVLQWLFFEQYVLEPAIAVVRFWVAYSGRPEVFEPERPAKMKDGERALRTLDRHLDGRDYVVGDSLTLADIALYGYTHVAEEGGFSLERYEAVGSWLARVASEPGHVPIDA